MFLELGNLQKVDDLDLIVNKAKISKVEFFNLSSTSNISSSRTVVVSLHVAVEVVFELIEPNTIRYVVGQALD